MHIKAATISTSYGPRRAFRPPPPITVRLSPRELGVLVRALEREAVQAERDGAPAAADALGWRIAALREARR